MQSKMNECTKKIKEFKEKVYKKNKFQHTPGTLTLTWVRGPSKLQYPERERKRDAGSSEDTSRATHTGKPRESSTSASDSEWTVTNSGWTQIEHYYNMEISAAYSTN